MFCSNCGKPLQEGEICSCQSSGAGSTSGFQQNADSNESKPIPGGQANQSPVPNRPYNQSPNPNGQYNQAPGNQYPQPGVPYNQFNASGQMPYNNQYHSGNPYVNRQSPPSYYQQQPYFSEDEKLKRYMSTPKFVAAREFMCSLPVLIFSISVSAILLYNFFVLQSFIHPLYLLLVIAGWITYATGISSKKKGILPSTAGLSIGSGVAITMLVIWCIIWGLIILLLGIGIIGTLSSNRLGNSSLLNSGFITVVIALVVSILVLVLGVKYYSIQSRILKGIKFCITNEANPKRFSVFPSVILFIGIVLTIISIIGTASLVSNTKLLNTIRNSMADYFNYTNIDNISPGLSTKLINEVMETYFSKSSIIKNMILSALTVFQMLSTAILYIAAKAKLNDFSEIS